MVKASDYNKPGYNGRKIILHLKNGKKDKGTLLSVDYEYDNDEGDGFILDVDGDTTVGRLITEDRVERVEFL